MNTLKHFLLTPQGSFLLAFLLGTLATYLAKKTAWKLNFLDKPKGTVPQHVKSTAYLGGIGIYVGFLTTNYIIGLGFNNMFLLFAGLFMILGLIDDIAVLRARNKFAIQVLVAVAAAKLCASFAFTGIEIIDLGISAFWYLVLLNAFNLTDVCDGLVGGITAIIMLFASLAFPSIFPFYLVIAGSIFGFLIFNSPPASIFMGDAGSHLLGFIAAYMTMSTSSVINPAYSFYILAALCAVPLSEITFLVIVRKSKGLKWWLSSKDHFCLRLQRHGFSKWQTDLFGYVLSCISALPLLYCLVSEELSILTIVIIYILLTAIFLTFWWYLIRIEKLDDARDASTNAGN